MQTKYQVTITDQFLSTSPARGTTWLFYEMDLCLYTISIHVPREGDDAISLKAIWKATLFLSTSPARGTTVPYYAGYHKRYVISIHVPREGDDQPA